LSKLFPSSGWAQDQVTLAKMAKNQPQLWCHSPKTQTFFHSRLKDLPHLLRVQTALSC